MAKFLAINFLILASTTILATNGQVAISQSEFEKGVTTANPKFPRPSKTQFQGYTKSLKAAGITSKLEAAMFLAQMLHESDGLRKKREDGCNGANGCPGKYPESGEWRDECKGSQRPSGVSYYGRGYLQLTWCSNYVQASSALGKKDQLKKNPDSVAKDEDLSWGVGSWFWKVNVHGPLGGTDQFGRTTKAINGQTQECQGNGQNRPSTEQRNSYYKKVFEAFKLPGKPNSAGCNI